MANASNKMLTTNIVTGPSLGTTRKTRIPENNNTNSEGMKKSIFSYSIQTFYFACSALYFLQQINMCKHVISAANAPETELIKHYFLSGEGNLFSVQDVFICFKTRILLLETFHFCLICSVECRNAVSAVYTTNGNNHSFLILRKE